MKLRKNYFVLLLISMMCAVVVVGCGGQTNESASTTNDESSTDNENEAVETMEPITLSLADFAPATHPIQAKLFPEWVKAIEEATDGLVKIELYPGGSLLGSGDVYSGVADGIADIGHDVSGLYPGRLPVLNALYLGGIKYENSAVSSYVARDLVAELQPEELQDTELMFIYGISPGVLMTTEPVESLDDLRGKQIRASGTNVATLEKLGATPVAMPVTETYEALSRGVVDGSLLPADTLKSFNLAEVTNYVTHSNLMYNTVHFVTMNKDKWNSLPTHIQEAIREVNEQTFKDAAQLFTDVVESGLQYAIDEHGVEEIHLSEEEEQRWEETLKPLVESHVEELNSAGLNGQEIMNKIVELSEKYNEEFGNN
ncbi:TRAP transporter substrate-binding protein [Halalkalibacter alkaliphilus]|uniref:TRAP transporter substrate-binding protein n=1 Tax=Halalkalibacter alkaliphilus TaxID=2917993 RepID=A0A9X2CUQ6_9BACI|nr:TRAP transporter substrate-binding protein [Halalkalibacter alkaliphilus]MCL7748710.1 TRAP transporter substrate-binding protein [Halalkalibacter alkaliphilus]